MRTDETGGSSRLGKPKPAGKACRRAPRLELLYLGLALVLCALAFGQLRRGPVVFRRRHVDLSQKTLIVYVYRDTDPEAVNNLLFFLEHAIQPYDGARYIVVLDAKSVQTEMAALPALPPNVEVWQPKNACFELGTVGQVLFYSTDMEIDLATYRYFIWTDSRARGPFLPVYTSGTAAWHSHLTAMLTQDIKLLGSTISCAGLQISKGQWVQHPYVQDYLMVTDRIGLHLLKDIGALDCHQTWLSNRRNGVMAASNAILRRGYGLASLMYRYQGVDWRDMSKWGCNAMLNPTQDDLYDGGSVQPLEVMFVKTSHPQLVTGMPAATQAAKMHAWRQELSAGGNVSSNAWRAGTPGKLEQYANRSSSCFDAELYVEASPVEFAGYSADDAWQHFLAFGLNEGRAHQFFC